LNASLRLDDAIHNMDEAVTPQFLFSTHGHGSIKEICRRQKKRMAAL